MRSHSGKRGREDTSAGLSAGILTFQSRPKLSQLVGAKVGEDFSVNFDHRSEVLSGQPDHLVERGFIGDHVDAFVLDAVVIKPLHRLMAPTTIRLNEQPNPLRFHDYTLPENATFSTTYLGAVLVGAHQPAGFGRVGHFEFVKPAFGVRVGVDRCGIFNHGFVDRHDLT
jgi:hypothetical protein